MPENYNNRCLAWTIHDLAFVGANYGVMKTTIIAKKPGRTAVSVKLTAQHLVCCKAASIPWTKAEEDVIRTQYACDTAIAQIMELLPGRTRNAIVFMAAAMGVVNARICSKEVDLHC